MLTLMIGGVFTLCFVVIIIVSILVGKFVLEPRADAKNLESQAEIYNKLFNE